MLLVNKDNIRQFLNTNANGNATHGTHKPIKKTRAKDDIEKAFLESLNIDSNNPKSEILIDSKGDKTITYLMASVKNLNNASLDDIVVGFDGENYMFAMNEDVSLLTRRIRKSENTIYADLKDIYEVQEEIPKELKFYLSTIELNNLQEVHNDFSNFKNNPNEKMIEKESSVKNDEVNTKKEKPTSNTASRVVGENQNINYQQQAPQQVIIQQVATQPQYNVSNEYLQSLEKFKRELGKKQLEEKEKNNKINFRNIKYPLPTNPLEKAIFLNGGTKPILCYGQQGSGKSYTAENYAKRLEAETGMPVSFYSILLEKNLDKADIVGSPVLKDDAFNYQKMAEAFLSARDGNLTVFLVDEIFRLKEMGTFFNLFGETHYKLDTGRQLEVVELITEDIDGKMQTANFCLLDRKVLNPDLVIEPYKVQYLKNENDEMFKKLPIQKVKDKLALGEIPIIERSDYEKFGLEALKVSSFYTSEQIKAPIEKLIIIAAGNVGKDYESHFNLDKDKAFKSRFAIVEQPAPELKDYLMVFERTLHEAKEKGYILWNKNKGDIDKEIENVIKYTKGIYNELFKLIKQNSFSSPSNFSHRNFVELAHNLCKQTEITSQTIKDCFMAQEKAVLPHIENGNSRVPVQADKIAYEKTIDVILGISNNGKSKNISTSKDANMEKEDLGTSYALGR